VAVRADDIALGCLGQHAVDAADDHPCDVADLRRRIAMVEIHRTLREAPTAIGARHRTQLIEEVGAMSPMCS